MQNQDLRNTLHYADSIVAECLGIQNICTTRQNDMPLAIQQLIPNTPEKLHHAIVAGTLVFLYYNR